MAVKKQRLKRLQDCINANTYAISKSMVGSLQPILLTAPSKKGPGIFTGRTENNRIVHVTAPADRLNTMVQARIVHATPHALMADFES